MLKKISIGGLFLFASVFAFSTATAQSTATKVNQQGPVFSPQAPVVHGWCPVGVKC
jgi:hypothetical protein